MNFNYEDSFKITRYPPYEKVLTVCMKGDLTIIAQINLDILIQVIFLLISVLNFSNIFVTSFTSGTIRSGYNSNA